MPSRSSVKKSVAGKEAVEETAATEAQTELLPAKDEDLNDDSGYEELGENTIQIVVDDQSYEDLDIADTEDALFEPEDSPPQDERLGRARDLVQEAQIGNAIELYRDILADSPRNVKARNNLGVLYDELGHPELALEQFEAAVGIDPLNIEVLTNYGSALAVLARYGEAEQLLLRAVDIDPDSVVVRASVGILNFRRGAYAAAELELRWVCEQDRESARAFYYHGETLNRLGRFDDAFKGLP